MAKQNGKTVIESILKNTHEARHEEMVDVLEATRKPDDYLRRMEREDKRYYDVTEAIKKYFQSIEGDKP